MPDRGQASCELDAQFRNGGEMPLICPTCQPVIGIQGGHAATVHGVVFDLLIPAFS
jgi:hypothetical protein